MTKIGKTSYRLIIQVRRRSEASYDAHAVLESETPFASMHAGESLTIGSDLKGFPGSTHATVDKVVHSLTGRAGVFDASMHLQHEGAAV
jgi:hypothetical protein